MVDIIGLEGIFDHKTFQINLEAHFYKVITNLVIVNVCNFKIHSNKENGGIEVLDNKKDSNEKDIEIIVIVNDSRNKEQINIIGLIVKVIKIYKNFCLTIFFYYKIIFHIY